MNNKTLTSAVVRAGQIISREEQLENLNEINLISSLELRIFCVDAN